MAPVRHKISAATGSSSSNGHHHQNLQKSKRLPHRQKPYEDGASSAALPGVQKVKAALRQTRRLLAKQENLAADVRTTTERRLKSLEADLAQAELARKERTLAARYHGVKFFERQKVTRRVQQVKRQLAELQENVKGKDDKKKSDGKELEKLGRKLEQLRVDLNYTIHYPKLKKYISLFPPELRSQSHTHPEPYPHTYSRPDRDGKKPENETDAQREEVRAWVREQMAAGEMSAEPELERQPGAPKRTNPTKASSWSEVIHTAKVSSSKHKAKLLPSSAKSIIAGPSGNVTQQDAFFGDDEEDGDGMKEDEESEIMGGGGDSDSDEEEEDVDED
ncbi:uncharacterized protein FIBRA_03057 [Fibroporia radiculosa]|uniref:rRNA-processing protein EFG1 n=1 Tax=Fibroporia radiculosa TaxID=599839 RepID=J4H270_9APHY|nr:uncharacterized protein FIBRA_03057 [Fibroporia radiculosa]CCM01009.1 predicted protein [Fibroporia radiculosa]